MVVLGTQIREQLGKLGLPPETLDARLGELSPRRLRQLGRLRLLDAQAAQKANRFAADSRGGRVRIPKAFSNPPPEAALEDRGSFVRATYGQTQLPTHPSSTDPLPHLLHRRRSGAARMSIALARRADLRARVGTAVGAQVAHDGRTDGVISIERGNRQSSTRQRPQPSAPSLPPPSQSYGTGSIWEIMMAMDQAILLEAARLGLGQGSGTQGTPGFLEAMGLWSLTPDDGDASEWIGFGQGGGSSASGMTGVPQPTGPTGTVGPENENRGLDVEIMRLKRMIDKKTQMMELYSQSLSKYNSSANNIIGNLKG